MRCSGREVTSSTVAAILTVLGYSIYDTIIIFDRVRENIPLMRRASMRDDRERLAVGDDPPVAGHVVHHASAGRCALPLRRRHAQGLRVRADGRYRIGCLLVDLHRGAAPLYPQGARARVRTPQGRDRERSAVSRKRWRSPRRSLREEPAPALAPVATVDGPAASAAAAKREQRRQRRRARPHGRAR